MVDFGFYIGMAISFLFLLILQFTKSFHIQLSADNNNGPQEDS